MKFLKPFSKFSDFLIEELISKDEVESSYLKMRPKRFKEFNTKLIDVFREDIDKYDNFIDFKKAIILDKSGAQTNLFAPKLAPKYSNLTFKDKDLKDLKDWWDWISRSADEFSRHLFNLFHEAKGRPQRTKAEYDSKGQKVDRYVCKINSIDDIKIFGPYKDSNRGDGTFYKILLPEQCLNVFKNKKFAIGEHGDKRNVEVEIEKYENKIHFPKGIAQELRGNDLGHWIYLAMIKKLGYVSSTMFNTPAIKQVYTDLVSLPKFENELMTLLLKYDVLIFDKNTKLDVKKIFREFIYNKYTDKKSVKCSPALKELLGEEFSNWYSTLMDGRTRQSIESKIKAFQGEKPEYGDIIWDEKNSKIYRCNGVWNDHKLKKDIIQLRHDYELVNLPYDSERYKVIIKKNNLL